MPQVVAAVIAAAEAIYAAAAAIAAVEITAGVTIGSLAASLATSAALGAASMLLRPKQQSFDQGSTQTFKAPSAASQIIYGDTRVGGVVLFMAVSKQPAGLKNGYLHLVIALSGHELAEISDIYLNDEIIPLEANGAAIGTSENDPGGGLANHLVVRKHLGGWNQDAEPLLLQAFPDDLTAADRFQGIAYLYVRMLWDTTGKKWPNGVPNYSARVKGRKVYDPRDPAQDVNNPDTWAWSKNWALCVADYVRGCPQRAGAGDVVRPYGLQADDSAIDWDTVTAEANISDESVAIAGGSESRFTCNGSLGTDVTPEDGLKGLLSAGGGALTWSGGLWRLFSASYRSAVASFGDDDQCGPSKTQARRARRDLFNGVKGRFKGPASKYQPTDFPPIANATFIAEDNGQEIWQDIELPFTDTASACQRLAKIELERNRQQIITERRFKLSALGTAAGDTIELTDSRKGWLSKPFVVTRWQLTTDQDANSNPFLCIDMTLAETAAAVFDWDSGEETVVDAAPDTDLPRPWEVSVPGAPAIIEDLYATRQGGGVKTKVTISWSASLDGYLADYVVEYKLTSSSTWTILPPTTDTTIAIFDVDAGIYDFRVKARNALGVPSLYSESDALTVYGLGAPPAVLTGLGIQPLGNQAMLAWTQSPDLDVREGGRIEFRHAPATSGATWDTATQIRDAVPGGDTSATVPLKAGTYLVRAVDSSEISGPVSSVTTKQASVNGFSSVAGSPITEETSFSGTHSGTVAVSSVLKLASAGFFDDIADFDAVTDLDGLGGIVAAGTYTFATAYNFGAVTRVRLTSKIAAVTTSILDNIDDWTANVDDRLDWDGAPDAGANAWVEFRQTDQNPAGSPTWSAWMRLDTAEVEAWGVQFRAQLITDDPAFNISLSTLQVAAETRT
jgi:hypothetical protein